MADRSEYIMRTVEVVHVASPLGRNRENPPHLSDLREFVEACSGLLGDLLVHVLLGRYGEGGRRDVTLKVVAVTPVTDDEIYWIGPG